MKPMPAAGCGRCSCAKRASNCCWARRFHESGSNRERNADSSVTGTYFGPISVLYEGGEKTITARLEGPTRNPPKQNPAALPRPK